MARNREIPTDLMVSLAGLMLATGGVFFSDPLLALSQRGTEKISIFLPVCVYVYFLTPITFYLNILSMLLHVTTHADAPVPAVPVSFKQYLPRVAGIVSLANLLVSVPLSVHVSVAGESVGFVICAVYIAFSLVLIIASALKKVLISNCHAGTGFMLAFFTLCISVGTFFISFDPTLSNFSNKNHHESLIPIIPIHLLLSFFSFFAFILSITLLLVYVRAAPADGPHVTIHVPNWVIFALCVCGAIATVLIGWYMIVYMAVY